MTQALLRAQLDVSLHSCEIQKISCCCYLCGFILFYLLLNKNFFFQILHATKNVFYENFEFQDNEKSIKKWHRA